MSASAHDLLVDAARQVALAVQRDGGLGIGRRRVVDVRIGERGVERVDQLRAVKRERLELRALRDDGIERSIAARDAERLWLGRRTVAATA